MRHRPPLTAFAPSELAELERAFEAAWAEIESANLIALSKDEALRRAVSRKLFSLVRSRPPDADELRDLLLSAVSADPVEIGETCPEHLF